MKPDRAITIIVPEFGPITQVYGVTDIPVENLTAAIRVLQSLELYEKARQQPPQKFRPHGDCYCSRCVLDPSIPADERRTRKVSRLPLKGLS